MRDRPVQQRVGGQHGRARPRPAAGPSGDGDDRPWTAALSLQLPNEVGDVPAGHVEIDEREAKVPLLQRRQRFAGRAGDDADVAAAPQVIHDVHADSRYWCDDKRRLFVHAGSPSPE